MFSLLRPAVVVAATFLLVPLGDLGSASGGPATAHVAGSVRTLVGPRASKPSKPKAKPRPVAADSAPNDPLWRDSWSLTKVRAPGAWRVTKGAADVVIAVLDTGIDRSHPDLQGAFVEGWDTVNEDADANDDHGHGTLVAGVIAARSNNGIGGVGACSQCSLMPVKVIGANGAGSTADIAEGIVWAADHGARVINMSFVLTGSDDNVAAAIAYAQARGALVVAAAGNVGTADVTYPAAYPGVVGVTGTNSADERYEWSSYGGWVRLAAPGCSVATGAGGSYADFCGTSSATALVAGLAGLMRSYAPLLTSDAVGQTFSANAVRVGDFVSAGRIDVEAALASLKPEHATSSTPLPAPASGAAQLTQSE